MDTNVCIETIAAQGYAIVHDVLPEALCDEIIEEHLRFESLSVSCERAASFAPKLQALIGYRAVAM